MKDSIVQSGEAVLREHAKAIPHKDIDSKKIHDVIRAMSHALKPEENGVAIAAPQIGHSLRMFLVAGKIFKEEIDEHGKKIAVPDMVFINPKLLRVSRKKAEMSEGCLSVRDVYGTVLRHEKASVSAYDEHGKAFTYHGTGLLAQIFQHEIDHLDGLLFIDKATSIDEPEKLRDRAKPRPNTKTKK